MAIKRKEELFGDNGAHGNQVPIEFTAPATPPGYGVACRAVGLGEELTSAIANRICYALALNDEDLDGRLDYFEDHGLDGMYRLGTNNVPGGGRLITLDGGAVEARSSLPSNLARDKFNAVFRADTKADTADGSVGFDFVARTGTGADVAAGAALFGFVDRRAVILNNAVTKISASVAAELNPDNGIQPTNHCQITDASVFSTAGDTDLLFGIDLVEILDGANAGLYLLGETQNATSCLLLKLDGTVPVFAPLSAVHFRVWRPTFASAGAQDPAATFSGITLAGLPADTVDTDAALLTLIAGAREGAASPARQGMRYALRTRVYAKDGEQYSLGAAINPVGGVEVGGPGRFGEPAISGAVGGNYTTSAVGIFSAASHSSPDYTPPLYGLVSTASRGDGFAAVYTSTGVIVASSAIGISAGAQHRPTAGSFVSVLNTATGILTSYRISGSTFTPGGGDPAFGTTTLGLVEITSNANAAFTPGGACTVYFLQSTVLGERDIVATTVLASHPNTARSTASIVGPECGVPPDADISHFPSQAHVVLHLASQSNSPRSFLIRGVQEKSEVFAVSAAGDLVTKGDLTASGALTCAGADVGGGITLNGDIVGAEDIHASQYLYSSTHTIEDIPIPPELMSTPEKQSDTYPGWYRNGGGSAWTIDPPSAVGIYRELILPITGLAPVGAELTKVKLFYSTANWLTNQSFVLRIFKRNAFSVTETEIASTVITNKASPGTLELAIPASNFTHRSSPMLFGVITSRNLTDQVHADAIILLHSAYFSCKVNGLES